MVNGKCLFKNERITFAATLIVAVVTAVWFASVLTGYFQKRHESGEAQTAAAAVKAEWKFGEDTDEFYGGKTRWAKLKSRNKAMFTGYDGQYGKRMVITVRDGKEGTTVELRVGGESFYICSNSPVKVRFDGGDPYVAECRYVADASDAVYVCGDRFWNDLRKSKELRVMCNFYGKGQHVFVFDTAGLENGWQTFKSERHG